jgi:hypothetical protein
LMPLPSPFLSFSFPLLFSPVVVGFGFVPPSQDVTNPRWMDRIRKGRGRRSWWIEGHEEIPMITVMHLEMNKRARERIYLPIWKRNHYFNHFGIMQIWKWHELSIFYNFSNLIQSFTFHFFFLFCFLFMY